MLPAPASTEDLLEVLQLVRSFDLPAEGISDTFPHAYAVMRRSSALVGVAGLEIYADVGLLRSVAVTTQERGRGLGRALVVDRLSAGRHRQLKCVYLLTLTAADYFRDAERAEVIACMDPLLNALPEPESQLLRWADMQGRSMRSIADELGISLTATKSRVQRARKEFMRVTQHCCAVTTDARGRVTQLTPHSVQRALECLDGCASHPKRSQS